MADLRLDFPLQQNQKARNPRNAATAAAPALTPALNPIVEVTGVFLATALPVGLEVGAVSVAGVFDIPDVV